MIRDTLFDLQEMAIVNLELELEYKLETIFFRRGFLKLKKKNKRNT